MNTTPTKRPRRREMEGPIARGYAKLRASASQLEAVRKSAEQLAAELPAGADVLEIAPGPGYHAVELARRGLNVVGLDISHTFVQIAGDYARKEAVRVDFHQGNAADLPFGDGSFDLIVCQAAFKNFTEPLKTLNEMHRVLRPGATAVIQDMRKEATNADIDAEVRGMGAGRLSAFFARTALTGLRHRAFSRERFETLAAQSAFGGCEIHSEGIGMEIRLTKPA
ncbi:class I SAM-dependent methyltransferase [Flindersiella endophytica]